MADRFPQGGMDFRQSIESITYWAGERPVARLLHLEPGTPQTMEKQGLTTALVFLAARIWSLVSIGFLLFMIAGHLFGSDPRPFNGLRDVISMPIMLSWAIRLASGQPAG